MKDQPLFSLAAPGEDDAVVQDQDGLFQWMVQAWLRFSGPNTDRFSSSLAHQELLRRSRILSILLPLILIAAAIAAPTAVPVPTYWIPILSLLLLGLVAFVLNRVALISLSGIMLVLAVDTALTVLMVTLPHGIRNSNIPDFDIFLLSTLIGGIVLPRRFLLALVIFHISLILALFTLLPHDPLLTQEIQVNQQGLAYGELSDAFLLQVIGAAIAWLNAWSVSRALVRASKAEELAQVKEHISEQMRLQMEQKARLEYGILVLKEAHARFANGDYKARANLQDNELVSLAFSFNLLTERLNRITQTALEHMHTEQAFQQLFAAQDAIARGGALPSLPPTGTSVDKIYPWLRQFYQLRQMYSHCGRTIEKVHLALLRQSTQLTQLTLTLNQAHTNLWPMAEEGTLPFPTLEGLEKSQQMCRNVEEQGKLCLQETKQLQQVLKAPV